MESAARYDRDVAGRYLKPGFVVGFAVGRVLSPLLMQLGLATTPAVRGRRSGKWRTVPVNVLEIDGQRYLVALRGDRVRTEREQPQ
jgi:hypothetical protein